MKKYSLIFIIFFYIILIVKFSSHVPIWDAWRSIDIWIKQAIFSPFNLFNFENAGHPSFSYYLPMSLLQFFDFGNVFYLHATSTFMGTLAIIFFHKTLRKVYSDTGNGELYLLTAIFSFFPIFIANQLHIGPDYAVLIFYIIFLYFYIKEDKILSVLTASFLMFTKEAGIMVYTATVVSFALVNLVSGKLSLREIAKQIKQNFIYIIPPILFAARILYRVFILKQAALWNTSSKQMDFLPFPPEIMHRVPLSYFLGIFIINFNWILTILVVIGFFAVFFRNRKKSLTREKRIIISLYLVFIISYFFLTFYKTFINVRYFLPLYVLMIILSYAGLKFTAKSDKLRQFLLIVIFLIFFISNFDTLDPISQKIWGTFNFGSHKLLKITSITGECCGFGRDQLTYNLEFTYFDSLQNRFYQDVELSSTDTIAYHPLDGPEIISRIDAKSHNRTARISTAFEPSVVTYTFPDLVSKPDRIYYLEFPNVDNEDILRYYLTYYNVEEIKTYKQDGYEMKVYLLKLKK